MPFIVMLLLAAFLALLQYLVFVFLSFVVIWAFALPYSPWLAGLGVWAIVAILRHAFRR